MMLVRYLFRFTVGILIRYARVRQSFRNLRELTYYDDVVEAIRHKQWKRRP